jgi:hypothetical protein
MSLASAISLTPRPFFCSTQTTTSTALSTNAPVQQTLPITFANGYLTTAGLQQISVAEWNALQVQNFVVKGVSTGTSPIIYELGAFTPVLPISGVVQPSTLTYFTTLASGSTPVSPTIFVTFNV